MLQLVRAVIDGGAMNGAGARRIAAGWVRAEGAMLPGFAGACIVGSATDLADDAVLDPTSDLDVLVVLERPDVPVKPGKFRYRGVLLEVSFIGLDDVRTPEQVLGHYHLARGIARARILADPAGFLVPLQREVARQFAGREWIERRVRQATDTVLVRLESINSEQDFAEQVMAWLFAAGGLPHVLLVAGLRNPTVRKRYVAVQEVLEEIGDRGGLHEAMLDLLDPHEVPAEQLRHHLDNLTGAFDAAAGVVRRPFPFASDLSPVARPLSIDGSRELIAAGLHREAIFWIVATFCRCQMALHADAPSSHAHRWDGAFRALMEDLGIRSFVDLQRRGEEVRRLLPAVWQAAEVLT